MAKPNPFASKKAPPFGKGGGAKKGGFEGSARDVEKFPEGSPKDMAMDRKQRAAPAPPMGMPPGPAFKRGGAVKRGKFQ
jgi:hypothetical protein